MKDLPQEIGKSVKKRRQAVGITQQDLALASGTGVRFIVDLEKGKPTCHWGKVLAVLDALGLQVVLESR